MSSSGKKNLEERLQKSVAAFAAVVPFSADTDILLQLDFTASNTALTNEILNDTNRFSAYIENKLAAAGATYGIGGYGEHRTIYSRSEVFGPSPTVSVVVPDGARAPSRWEGEDEVDLLVEEETVGYRYADPVFYKLLKAYAIQHRAKPTEAEEAMWQLLKTKKLSGYKFRRQHIIDRFIADFVCLKEKLVIEIDGLIHQLPENKISDVARTERLNGIGFRLIRFTNSEVLYQTDNVINTILIKLKTDSKLKEHNDLSSPSHREGAGGWAAPRRLHLGTDIWGPAGTPVFAPLDAVVHSTGFHPQLGDYGAVIILEHKFDELSFYTLYGHLSKASIENKNSGDVITKGEQIATFGTPPENGWWPPHLHFQIIKEMQGYVGDYPGVCRYAEREAWLQNCPDPDLILGLMQYAS